MNRFFLFLLCSVFLLTSCKNEEFPKEKELKKFEIKTRGLSFNEVRAIATALEKIKPLSNQNDARKVISQSSDDEILDIISPLIDNGEQIYVELLYQINETPEWDSLSEVEKSEILYMTDVQKAQLALINIDFSIEGRYAAISGDRAIHCIASALGISAINDIITGTVALTTVQTATQLLKVMGKRYLGYIGLAIAVYEFVQCVN